MVLLTIFPRCSWHLFTLHEVKIEPNRVTMAIERAILLSPEGTTMYLLFGTTDRQLGGHYKSYMSGNGNWLVIWFTGSSGSVSIVLSGIVPEVILYPNKRIWRSSAEWTRKVQMKFLLPRRPLYRLLELWCDRKNRQPEKSDWLDKTRTKWNCSKKTSGRGKEPDGVGIYFMVKEG